MPSQSHLLNVHSFTDLLNVPFSGNVNAICYQRHLRGNFEELVAKLESRENILEIDEPMLMSLQLTDQGELAREVILSDMQVLADHGAQPVLNLIRGYERDMDNHVFPTDVYSWHVDRSPVATSTFLCTYYGAPTEILPNAHALQKIKDPLIRSKLLQAFAGREEGLDEWLEENSYDLHYQEIPGAQFLRLANFNLYRLAVEHPGAAVPPCIHRAPFEFEESRLLLIC